MTGDGRTGRNYDRTHYLDIESGYMDMMDNNAEKVSLEGISAGFLDGTMNVRDNMRIGKRDIGQTNIHQQEQ